MPRNIAQLTLEIILFILCIDVNQKTWMDRMKQEEQEEKLLHAELTGNRALGTAGTATVQGNRKGPSMLIEHLLMLDAGNRFRDLGATSHTSCLFVADSFPGDAGLSPPIPPPALCYDESRFERGKTAWPGAGWNG